MLEYTKVSYHIPSHFKLSFGLISLFIFIPYE